MRSSAANLDAAKTWPSYCGIAANLHTGGNNGNALSLRVKTGTGGLHPVPRSAHWERTCSTRIRAIDGMGKLVWVVDIGKGQNGRDRKRGRESSAFRSRRGEIDRAGIALGRQ